VTSLILGRGGAGEVCSTIKGSGEENGVYWAIESLRFRGGDGEPWLRIASNWGKQSMAHWREYCVYKATCINPRGGASGEAFYDPRKGI